MAGTGNSRSNVPTLMVIWDWKMLKVYKIIVRHSLYKGKVR